LRKVIDMVKPMANMNSVKISHDLAKSCIIGSIQHFQQCFLNLLKNSIEAMPNGGELNIVSLICEDKVVIKIQDNGMGMTQEQIGRFGEPYFSTKETGTGLGAMVALKIIETMNGTLDIDSAVNKGTTLTITFPQSNE
jgi:two-component system sporulation sensor kinase B